MSKAVIGKGACACSYACLPTNISMCITGEAVELKTLCPRNSRSYLSLLVLKNALHIYSSSSPYFHYCHIIFFYPTHLCRFVPAFIKCSPASNYLPPFLFLTSPLTTSDMVCASASVRTMSEDIKKALSYSHVAAFECQQISSEVNQGSLPSNFYADLI